MGLALPYVMTQPGFDKKLRPAKKETVMHLLEPFLQVLADNDFSESIHFSVVKNILGNDKMAGGYRSSIADEMFEMASDMNMPGGARKRFMTLVKQLQVEGAEVGLEAKERVVKQGTVHAAARLKKGLGVRTRNEYKKRGRDKR